MIRAGAVLLLAADQTSGFVGTSRRHRATSSRLSGRVPSDGIAEIETRLSPTSSHLSREASVNSLRSFTSRSDGFLEGLGLARRSPGRSGRRSGGGGAVKTRTGMATQLGGWSYARTVLSNVSKDSGDGGAGAGADGGESGASSPAASHQRQSDSGGAGSGQSDASGGSSSANKRSSKSGGMTLDGGGGGGGGGGGDGGGDKGGDDDEDEEDNYAAAAATDSWDMDSYHSQEGLLDSFSEEEEEEFEVVCDGDVCERKPVGPKVVHAGTAAIDASAVAAAAAAPAAAAAAAVTEDGGSDEGGSSEMDDSAAADTAPGGDEFPGDMEEDAVEGEREGGGEGDGVVAEQEEDPGVAQLVAMGWEADESAAALADTEGDVVGAAEALAEKEEEDLERYKEGLADLQQRGWDEEVAMSAMREAAGNSTAALLALEEEDRMLSEQFDQSIFEMVEHGWDEEVARKALLMQWQKDIEGRGGSRKAQKQFEKTVKGVKAQGAKEGKDNGGGGKQSPKQDKKKDEPPAPTPAKREDVVFDVTDKTLQKVVLESPVPVILDVYAEWCGPCKQLTPALEEAAMRSGGMFRVAKVDADKQRSLVEVLGVAAFPSIFGLKNGIIVDNFVGILPQDEMQSFMMGVIMGLPPGKDKELREHQKSQTELRGMSRKLAHVAGLAVLGSRKKENICLKVDKALAEMLPDLPDGSPAAEDGIAVAGAKKAARTVITVLMSAYKFPEDPKFRKLSTSSKVYQDVLSTHPPMLEVLRLAGFRQQEGGEGHLALLHRNMAVLASVQDRVEVWNRSVKMPEVEEDDIEDEYDSEDEEDEEERRRAQEARDHLASVAKLQITAAAAPGSVGKKGKGQAGRVVKMEMPAESTLGELFRALQDDEGFGDDLVLTTTFPKRELAASDATCHASTLLSLGLAPSARLTATNAAALASEKDVKGGDAEEAAARKEGLRAKMMEKSRDGQRKSKKGGTLFGASDGIIEVNKSKHQEYFGGDSTVTLAAEESEEEDADGEGKEEKGEGSSEEDDFGDEADSSAQGGHGGVDQSEPESDEESQGGSMSSFEEHGRTAAGDGGMSAGSSETAEEVACVGGAYNEEETEEEEEGGYDSDVSGSEEDFSESPESYAEDAYEEGGRGEGGAEEEEDYSAESDWSGESDDAELSCLSREDGEMIVEVSEDGQLAPKGGQDSQEGGDSYDDDSYDPDDDESDYESVGDSYDESDGDSYDESDGDSYDESDGDSYDESDDDRERGGRNSARSQRDRK